MCIYCLFNDEKSAKKVWSKNLVYKGIFRLLIRIPSAYTISNELLQIIFYYLNI